MKRKLKELNQTQAAAALGVTREHLNRVLNGHRDSRRLMAAYRHLQEAIPARIQEGK